MVAPTHRIDYIDGLRAVAVLAVVLAHSLWKGGAHGVDLFFVLSGFCLSYPTLRRLHETGSADFDLIGYGAKRIVRIVPAYWAAIAALVVVYFVASYFRMKMPWPEMLPYGFSWLEVLKQAFFVDTHTSFLNGSFWSICVEFRWYFIFPVVLWLWVKHPMWFAAVALTVLPIGLIFDAKTGLSLIDPLVLPAFMLGIVAAHIQLRGVRWIQRLSLFAAVALLAVSLIWPQPRIGSVVCELCAFAFVVAAGYYSLLSRALSVRVMVVIGLASYSSYLIHQPVIAITSRLGLWVYASILAAIILSFAFWWIAERPFVSGKPRKALLAFLVALVRVPRQQPG
jgi:peptidoglycan/LPS O-acetylase OafA/YrhL